MVNFWHGLVMGLAYLAPLGLQNIFVINTALAGNRKKTFLTALAVIFFDVTLAWACFFGVGALLTQLKWLKYVILLIGSLVIMYLGFGLLRSQGPAQTGVSPDLPGRKIISTACAVTWLNPQALIDGTMLLGAFRSTLEGASALCFIAGVTLASCLWFAGISFFVGLCSQRFSGRVLRVINIVCGLVIIFYGLKLLYTFFNLV